MVTNPIRALKTHIPTLRRYNTPLPNLTSNITMTQPHFITADGDQPSTSFEDSPSTLPRSSPMPTAHTNRLVLPPGSHLPNQHSQHGVINANARYAKRSALPPQSCSFSSPLTWWASHAKSLALPLDLACQTTNARHAKRSALPLDLAHQTTVACTSAHHLSMFSLAWLVACLNTTICVPFASIELSSYPNAGFRSIPH